MRRPSVVRRHTVALFGALLVGAACDTPPPTAPTFRPGFSLFAVLNPASSQHLVHVMRTREAVTDRVPSSIDALDPIVSAGETPIMGATVILYGANGDSAVAVEDRVRRTDGKGAGLYRLWGSGSIAAAPAGAYLPVLPGNTYRLRVVTPLGEAVGHTRIPSGPVVAGISRVVNTTQDSVVMSPDPVSAAGFLYALRNATNLGLEGEQLLRRALDRRLFAPPPRDDWAFVFARERIERGGRYVMTVTAADSNYFEYYGAEFDPFADRTGRTNLRGASGVFGSVLVLYSVTTTFFPVRTGP